MFEWVYNAGSAWAPLDHYTQNAVETLWNRNSATWIQSSPTFSGHPVFIDTSRMILICGGYTYTIARRYNRR
ncbi:hypothetical protein BX666DRAFT_982446 [Dichotomocladium elegans]|nr:hypothetical protein BX666DRAFT_982446 [Dichotomocladium elegans]